MVQGKEADATEVIEFIDKARLGEPMSTSSVIRIGTQRGPSPWDAARPLAPAHPPLTHRYTPLVSSSAARLFKDELTLANIARPQLVSMCQYMGLTPYGADAFLRFQLRTKLTAIKEDDRRILWEGVDELTMDEIREACQVRANTNGKGLELMPSLPRRCHYCNISRLPVCFAMTFKFSVCRSAAWRRWA